MTATDATPADRTRMNVVIAGHVDHGKSTIIGRLLADTGSLPTGKIEQVRERCARTARPFEYAFLLDALKDEQAQGITIDSARVFFKTARRDYIIIDAPGHVEFLKNMVTGASRAEAALLVIDAKEGVRENSRRHGYLLSLLGIRQLAVLVNKMDLVGYDRGRFDQIAEEYRAFLTQIGVTPLQMIPVSGREGGGLTRPAEETPWYDGPGVLEILDQFVAEPPPDRLPFRMPVQDVYKFTNQGDERRIVAGTVEAGTLRVGDTVVFYPSGKSTQVRSLEAFNRAPPTEVTAGWAAGFTLTEQVFVPRGEIAARVGEPAPSVTTRLRVSLFWLGRDPLETGKEYLLKLGTARVPARLEEVIRVIDASSLGVQESKARLDRHDVGECVLALSRAVAFDLAEEIAPTGRFVLVDGYEIRGGGIVREALPDRATWLREKVLLRNLKWEPSIIPPERRAEKLGQRAQLVLITGAAEADRKTLAKDLEARLFDDGRVVYFVGIANVLYGVDADIERGQEQRQEHFRRLAEVANLMLDAGVILIVTASELTQDDLEILKASVDPERLQIIWVGDRVSTDVTYDLRMSEAEAGQEGVARLKRLLQDRGIVFSPW